MPCCILVSAGCMGFNQPVPLAALLIPHYQLFLSVLATACSLLIACPAHRLPVCPCCLPCRLLLNNSLSGSLPEAWVGLSTLRLLDLTGNRLEGSLPEGWAAQGAMPQLRTLILAGNAISGKLPGAWARPEALPALSWLDMSFNIISGGLPDEWGMPNSFPRLRLL